MRLCIEGRPPTSMQPRLNEDSKMCARPYTPGIKAKIYDRCRKHLSYTHPPGALKNTTTDVTGRWTFREPNVPTLHASRVQQTRARETRKTTQDRPPRTRQQLIPTRTPSVFAQKTKHGAIAGALPKSKYAYRTMVFQPEGSHTHSNRGALPGRLENDLQWRIYANCPSSPRRSGRRGTLPKSWSCHQNLERHLPAMLRAFRG